MLCWFPLYNNTNQLHVHVYEPLCHPHPTPLGHHGALNWAPCAAQQPPVSQLSTRGGQRCSPNLPHSSLPHPTCSLVHSLRLRFYCPANRFISGLPRGLSSKESPCHAGTATDAGSIPGLGRSPGGGNGNWLQCSCLDNPIDRGSWWAIVHRVAKSQTQLRDWTATIYSLIYNICFSLSGLLHSA